jgi:hypothetical protein
MNLRKLTLSTAATAVAPCGGVAKAGPIEVVYGLQVSDAGALVRALDTLFQAHAMKGNQATLWASVFTGTRPSTHVVTAPTMAELNTYLDGLYASDAFRTFTAEVGDIRKLQTVSMYRRVKMWTH